MSGVRQLTVPQDLTATDQGGKLAQVWVALLRDLILQNVQLQARVKALETKVGG